MSLGKCAFVLAVVAPVALFASWEMRTSNAQEGAKAPRQRPGATGSIVWGKPVEGQSLSLAAEKATFACGEPIWLALRLKNSGAKPVTYWAGRRNDPYMEYAVELRLPDGKLSLPVHHSIERITKEYAKRNHLMLEAVLAPGHEVFRGFPLNGPYQTEMSRPGKYTVTVRLKVAMPGGGFSEKEAVSNTLEVNVEDLVAAQLKKEREQNKSCRRLYFSPTWITDDALQYVDGLTQLKSLYLNGAQNLTDAGIEHLKQLPSLEILDVSDTGVTDLGLKSIGRLVSLTRLNLDRTKVTDAGLKSLRGLRVLEQLLLDEDEISDAGLEHLRAFTQLRVLGIRKTRVRNGGLRHLKAMSDLYLLDLGDTAVGDEGLKHLQGLANLKWLVLEGTAITDAGLGYLRGLKNLEHLDLRRTKVTSKGVEKLQHALPHCAINFDE